MQLMRECETNVPLTNMISRFVKVAYQNPGRGNNLKALIHTLVQHKAAQHYITTSVLY